MYIFELDLRFHELITLISKIIFCSSYVCFGVSRESHLLWQQEQGQQVLWLLKHGLLQQLHTYVYLAPPITPDGGLVRVSGREIGGTGQLGSHGTSSPASTSIPTPTVHEPPSLSHDPPSLTPQTQIHQHTDITRDALHHAAAQLSQPASESDLGSGIYHWLFFAREENFLYFPE